MKGVSDTRNAKFGIFSDIWTDYLLSSASSKSSFRSGRDGLLSPRCSLLLWSCSPRPGFLRMVFCLVKKSAISEDDALEIRASTSDGVISSALIVCRAPQAELGEDFQYQRRIHKRASPPLLLPLRADRTVWICNLRFDMTPRSRNSWVSGTSLFTWESKIDPTDRNSLELGGKYVSALTVRSRNTYDSPEGDQRL